MELEILGKIRYKNLSTNSNIDYMAPWIDYSSGSPVLRPSTPDEELRCDTCSRSVQGTYAYVFPDESGVGVATNRSGNGISCMLGSAGHDWILVEVGPYVER